MVTAPGGPSNALSYTYVLFPPAIGYLYPSAGPLAGGNSVRITGRYFSDITGVTFGGTTAAFTVDSDTLITAIAPAHPAGTVLVEVSNPAGTASHDYTYMPAPSVTAIDPAVGHTAGWTSVIITGTDFFGATGVTFGGTTTTSHPGAVNSPTSDHAPLPRPMPPAPWNVVVIAPGGSV